MVFEQEVVDQLNHQKTVPTDKKKIFDDDFEEDKESQPARTIDDDSIMFDRNMQALENNGMGFDRSSTKMMKIGEVNSNIYSRNGTEIMRIGEDDSDLRSRGSTQVFRQDTEVSSLPKNPAVTENQPEEQQESAINQQTIGPEQLVELYQENEVENICIQKENENLRPEEIKEDHQN